MTVEPRVDPAVLLLSFGATTVALFVTAVTPAWQSSRADVRTALAADPTVGALPRWRARRLLVAAQVAVSMLLLVLASLYLGQLRAQSRIDTGFDLARLAVAEVDFAEQGVDQVRVDQIAAAVVGQLSHRPDVEVAAVSSGLPIGLTNLHGSVRGPDDPPRPIEFISSSPGIFQALGVSIVRGRAFDDTDTAGTEPVVVINETAARQVFDSLEVVGRQVEVQRSRWVGEEPQPARMRTIIGVAADSDAGSPGQRRSGVVYLPFAQQPERRLVFSARAADGDPSAILSVIRSAVAAADRSVGIGQIGPGEAVLAPPSIFAQVSAAVTGLLGGFALVLAMSGLYGILSQIIARRTREIGVRLALGAGRRDILRLIVREGLSPVVLGLVVGGLLAWLGRQSLRTLVLLVPGADLVALAVVPALLLVVGFLACYLPARRAAGLDPTVPLRDL